MIFKSGHPWRIRRNIYLCVTVLFVGYQGINAFVKNVDMILATRVFALGFYTAVMYIYLPDAWRAAVAKRPQHSDFLVVGI